jgi:hypothetical protein
MYALQIEYTCFKETLGEKHQQVAFREGGNRSPERYAGFFKTCIFNLQYIDSLII